jgi:N-acetylated-alpha-linked acidic dipeptidase
VPYVSLAPLLNARARVEESARAFEAAWKARTAAGEIPADTQKALDAVLMGAERSLTRAEGLPRRPWFVHQVYAPGFYTGYGVKTLPAVRESLEQREWTQAEEQAKTVASVLEGFAAQVDRATALLSLPSSLRTGLHQERSARVKRASAQRKPSAAENGAAPRSRP